jgi:excisionase family DNA binding protein
LSATASLPDFLTIDEIAVVLRCQPEKVYRLAARGELPSYKIEGRRLVDRVEFLYWLETRHTGVPSEASSIS